MITTFFTSLVVAAAIDSLTMPGVLRLRMSWVYGIALSAAIGLSVWYTVESVILPTSSRAPLVRPQNFLESGFIPAGAMAPQNLPAGPLATITPPSGEVQVVRWEPLDREVRVDSAQPAILRLRTYNFPGWEARVDGQPAEILSDSNGAQVVNILAGSHIVEVVFVNTPARTLGSALTGVAVLLICALISLDVVRRRRLTRKAASPQASNLSEAFPATREASRDEETSCSVER